MPNINVCETYLEMTRALGMSDREAIAVICKDVGIKFNASYSTQWRTGARPTPPKAVREMQQRVALYAAKKAGINTTDDKAKDFGHMLSPAIK